MFLFARPLNPSLVLGVVKVKIGALCILVINQKTYCIGPSRRYIKLRNNNGNVLRGTGYNYIAQHFTTPPPNWRRHFAGPIKNTSTCIGGLPFLCGAHFLQEKLPNHSRYPTLRPGGARVVVGGGGGGTA